MGSLIPDRIENNFAQIIGAAKLRGAISQASTLAEIEELLQLKA